MKRMQVLLALAAGTSLLALSPLDAQTRPAPGTPTIQPVRPGGPQIQPPRPVKPTPVRPEAADPAAAADQAQATPSAAPCPSNPGASGAADRHQLGRSSSGLGLWPRGAVQRQHYGGRSVVIRHNVPDLRSYGFNDRAQSMHARGRWQVCEKLNYRGRCHIVRGSDPLLGRLNRDISSLRYLGH